MAMQYAKRMEYLKASEIRELLKVTADPAVISFAGGAPAPELFPVRELAEISRQVLAESGREALQYGPTEGLDALRRQIAARMNRRFKTDFTYENILITSGSQQGLDFSGKIFLNEGDVLLCEKPMYLAAINAFRAYLPQFVEVPTDGDGMIVSELERLLNRHPNARLIYIVPDFQNPTGISWSPARREAFMRVINEHNVPVVEDSPYAELRFEGTPLPSVKSMDQKGQVICLGTFSKTFCPGLRVGWVAAEKEILDRYILVKQSADLHTSGLSQREIAKYLECYDFDAGIERIKATYKKRRDIMLETMAAEFPKDVQYTRPQGGLFTWVELPQQVNAREVLVKSLEQKVAFVPGGAFFPNGGMENTMRLNFSNMPEERIVEGIKRLGAVLTEFINNAAAPGPALV